MSRRGAAMGQRREGGGWGERQWAWKSKLGNWIRAREEKKRRAERQPWQIAGNFVVGVHDERE